MTQKHTQTDPLAQVDQLKEEVLKKEAKKEFHSERFLLLEKQIKEDLAKQATDEALKDISIGALIL